MIKEKYIKLSTLFSLFFTFSACSQQVDTVSVFEAERLLMNDSAIVAIDGRDSLSYAQGHLPNAIHIDAFDNDIPSKIEVLDKDKTYLVYCRTHNRADIIVSIMKEKGFDKLYLMPEGFLVYVSNDLKTEK